MNGLYTTAWAPGWPATAVLRLGPAAPVAPSPPCREAAEEALAAAVRYPPRAEEVRPLGELLPDVLARYQLKRAERHAAELQ